MFVCAVDLLWRTCVGLWSVLEHSYLCLWLAWWQCRWQWVAVEHSFSASSWDRKQMAGRRVKAYQPASKPPFSSREYHHTRVLLLIEMQYFVSLNNWLYWSGSVFFMMLKNSSLLTARKKEKSGIRNRFGCKLGTRGGSLEAGEDFWFCHLQLEEVA